VRFEEREAGGEQTAVTEPGANPVRGQAGEIEEPSRAPFVGQGRRKRRERKRLAIGWRSRGHRVRLGQGDGEDMAKILVVEDNALNIKLFCDLLAAHGHQPEAVTDGREALGAARDFRPDLVITDIQLPHVSGLELIEMIRKDDDLSAVPIMAVTAYAGAGDEERVRAAGAQAYVSKPISVMRFAETVDQLLEDGPIDRDEKGGPDGAAPLEPQAPPGVE
jgi:two-component system cell cycle response regulator DivK